MYGLHRFGDVVLFMSMIFIIWHTLDDFVRVIVTIITILSIVCLFVDVLSVRSPVYRKVFVCFYPDLFLLCHLLFVFIPIFSYCVISFCFCGSLISVASFCSHFVFLLSYAKSIFTGVDRFQCLN